MRQVPLVASRAGQKGEAEAAYQGSTNAAHKRVSRGLRDGQRNGGRHRKRTGLGPLGSNREAVCQMDVRIPSTGKAS